MAKSRLPKLGINVALCSIVALDVSVVPTMSGFTLSHFLMAFLTVKLAKPVRAVVAASRAE